LGQAR